MLLEIAIRQLIMDLNFDFTSVYQRLRSVSVFRGKKGIRYFWLMGYSGKKITLREIWLIKYPSRQLNACERLAPALFYSHDKGGG